MSTVEIYFLWFGIYAAFIVFLVVFFVFRHRGKMRVWVKDPLGDRLFWRKAEEDEEGDFVQMRDPSNEEDGKFGWVVHFQSKHIQKGKDRLGRSYDYIEVMPEAQEACYVDWNSKSIMHPELTRAQAARINKLHGFEHHWGKGAAEAIPKTLIYAILIMTFISIGISFIVLMNMPGVHL